MWRERHTQLFWLSQSWYQRRNKPAPGKLSLKQAVRTVQEVQLTCEVRVRQMKDKIPTPPFIPPEGHMYHRLA